ncbi:hypothetical protein OHA72_47135 [Dactylosporangium sp. NBC_01737]|nr:hypothetical protein OHA72_47135 [Dactylosporangium sp. NBC_01737]
MIAKSFLHRRGRRKRFAIMAFDSHRSFFVIMHPTGSLDADRGAVEHAQF